LEDAEPEEPEELPAPEAPRQAPEAPRRAPEVPREPEVSGEPEEVEVVSSDEDDGEAMAKLEFVDNTDYGDAFSEEHKVAQEDLVRVRRSGFKSAAKEASAMLSLAKLQLSSAKYGEALRLAKEVWRILDEANEDALAAQQAEAVAIQVRAHLEDEKLQDALQLAAERQRYFKDLNEREAEATIHLVLAEVHLKMERPKEALKATASALQAFRDLRDRLKCATALQASSNAHLRLGGGGLRTALKDAMEAHMLLETEDSTAAAAALLTISKVHLAKQDFDEALSYADKSVTLARQLNNKKAEAAALREAATVWLASGQESEMALNAGMEALGLFEDIGDPLGWIAARTLVAGAQHADGKTEQAIKSMELALAKARHIEERVQIAGALDFLVQLHASNENKDQVLAATQEEVALAKGSNDPRRKLSALQRLVGMQLTLEMPKEAMKSAEQAVELLKSTNDKNAQAWAQQLLAEVFDFNRDFKKALAAVEKAEKLFEEVGNIREVVKVMEMKANIYASMDDGEEALKCRKTQREVYRKAGWHNEEVDALLAVADLLLSVRGPRAAEESGREAVQLRKGMDDKEGEAYAMIALATYQKGIKSSGATEAVNSTKTARKILQVLGNAGGEAQALRVQADVYLENGALDSAVQSIREAQSACSRAGLKQEEATFAQFLVGLHVQIVQRDVERGRSASKDTGLGKRVKDALEAVTDSIKLFQGIRDERGEVTALIQRSSLNLMSEAKEAALKAAEEALELALQIDDVQAVGSSNLALAEAYLALENKARATEAATTAKQLFERMGDEGGAEGCAMIIEAAKNIQSTSASASAEDALPTVGQGGRPLRKAFTELSGQLAGQQPSKAAAAAPDQKGPDQDVRRQQMMNALNQPPLPQHVMNLLAEPEERQPRAKAAADHDFKKWKTKATGASSLMPILAAVRPDMSITDRQRVVEKFKKIDINTEEDLFDNLNTGGPHAINRKLRAIGQKTLLVDTLKEMLEYGKRKAAAEAPAAETGFPSRATASGAAPAEATPAAAPALAPAVRGTADARALALQRMAASRQAAPAESGHAEEAAPREAPPREVAPPREAPPPREAAPKDTIIARFVPPPRAQAKPGLQNFRKDAPPPAPKESFGALDDLEQYLDGKGEDDEDEEGEMEELD